MNDEPADLVEECISFLDECQVYLWITRDNDLQREAIASLDTYTLRLETEKEVAV
jgi:hypothetical protein